MANYAASEYSRTSSIKTHANRRYTVIPYPKAPLEVHPVPKYTPGPTELLVRNEVIGLNPVEAKTAILGVIPINYLEILGSTFGGTIEAVGSRVTKFHVGDRVVTSKRFKIKGNQYGAYQRFVVVKDIMVSRMPDEVDLAVPASLMMNLTCVVGLFTGRLGLRRPSMDGVAEPRSVKVLVYGGSSSFGGLSVQYLSQAGYKVVTTSSPKNRSFVDALGATVVIDHTLDQDAIINALLAEGPYDIVVDFISVASTIAVTARVLEAQGGGTLYTIQPGSEALPAGVTRAFEPYSESLYEEKNRELQEWVIDTYMPQGLAQSLIKPLPIEVVKGGLTQINETLQTILNGSSGIRYVADPWD
ncbi:hypothetical protein N0V90_004904 [Kalmusia sp. IMI 367209]|nr:hypothetical protein N0V90_004904 [Kalmusia sp. IMI 367209]